MKMWRNMTYRTPSVGSVPSSETLHYKWDLPLCCRTLGRQAGGWCWRVELLWATVDIWCSGMNGKCWSLWSGAAWPWWTSRFVTDWSCPPWWNTLFSQLSCKKYDYFKTCYLYLLSQASIHRQSLFNDTLDNAFWFVLTDFSDQRTDDHCLDLN